MRLTASARSPASAARGAPVRAAVVADEEASYELLPPGLAVFVRSLGRERTVVGRATTAR